MPAGGPKSEEESTEMADATIEDSTEATPEAAEIAEATEVPETTSEESTETSEESTESTVASDGAKRKIQWSRVFAYGVLPALALLLALAAGFSRWEYVSSDNGVVPPVASEQNPSPATESMNAAKDSTIKMLSYKPDTVDQQLNAARDLLTGEFRDSYTSLINDVVIPGAQQKQISAVASVPAVASVSADPKRAVVLVFVNQTVVVGQDPPSDTASSVRVTMEKVDDRWLISEFEPV
jgi:Mce-associated membrane protein